MTEFPSLSQNPALLNFKAKILILIFNLIVPCEDLVLINLILPRQARLWVEYEDSLYVEILTSSPKNLTLFFTICTKVSFLEEVFNDK